MFGRGNGGRQNMPDPFGSLRNMASGFFGFMQNPAQMIGKMCPKMPQNIQNDPDAMIQYLMNQGMVSQDMYNAANRAAQQAQGNPMFQQMMKKR